MEELDDGLLIYSNSANLVADSFLLDSWDFSTEGFGASIGNNGSTHSLFPDHDRSSSLNSILDSARCSYIAQPNSDILPFSTLEDVEMGLEWLSAFEESSSASGSGNSGEFHKNQSNPEPKHVFPSFSVVIPCRARSKRSRLQVHPPKSITQDTFSMLTQTSQSHVQSAEDEEEEEEKKLKKVKRKGVKGNGNGSSGQPRRCTHCQTQKTPQWRQGPLGPKSLCNACGVRFKTGRLYPEYRPAKSPSFVSFLHSNSHKKVLEMRTLGIPDIGIELPASAAAVQIMSHRSYDFC